MSIFNRVKALFSGNSSSVNTNNPVLEEIAGDVQQIAEDVSVIRQAVSSSPVDAASVLDASDEELSLRQFTVNTVDASKDIAGGLKVTITATPLAIPASEASQWAGKSLRALLSHYAPQMGVDLSTATTYMIDGKPATLDTIVPGVPVSGQPVRVSAMAPAGENG